MCSCISFGADYLFEVQKNYSAVVIQKDGSANIYYTLVFKCAPYARPIDIVDIGLPHQYYDLNSASAAINGKKLPTIRKSSYVKYGVEIPLEYSTMINPGQTGELQFAIHVSQMVYHDTEKKEYASVEFSPTWYGDKFTVGTTDLKVSIYFPEGVQNNETIYHRTKFSAAGFNNNRIVFTWDNQYASPSQQYFYGVSFPARYVDKIYEDPTKTLGGRIDSLIKSIRIPPGFLIFFIFFIIIAAVNIGKAIAGVGRKKKYFPAELSVEGLEVKKGLTAVEAAVLLERPLNQVASFLLYGIIKKGALRIIDANPLMVEIIDTPDKKEKLYDYEEKLIEGVNKVTGQIPKSALRETLVFLIKIVQSKMLGYNLKKTREYYEYIVKKAWAEVYSAGTGAKKAETLMTQLEWAMLDKEYYKKVSDITKDFPTTINERGWGWQDYYHPYHTYGGHPHHTTASPTQGSDEIGKLPGADFANQVVSSLENFSNTVITDVESFTASVTNITNPIPISERGSWGGGGGGGCACACACAGCACACAGGGR